jgi:hypothetical protein
MTGSRFLSKINVACRVVDILNNAYILSLTIYAARFNNNHNNNNIMTMMNLLVFFSSYFQGSMCIFCLLKMM